MKTSFFQKILPLGVIIIVSFIVLFPLFRPGFILTDDGSWMVVRLSAFYQSLREGQFPVRFLGRLNYSYGYPVSNFLYPGFMYVGSLFKFLGLSFVDSVKFIIIISVFGSGVLVRQWLRTYFGSLASTIGAVSFLTAPYLLFDIYKRGSVGEIFAFLWAALSFYSIARDKRWVFSLSVFFLILSHNSLAVLFIITNVLYLMAVKRFSRYILPLALGVGMATFFWLPAIYERRFVIFDRIVISDPRDYLSNRNLWWLVGATGVLAAIASVFRRQKHSLRPFFFWTFVLTASMTLPISVFLWQSKMLTMLFQFPFRFLSVSVLAASFLVACVIHAYPKLRYVLSWAVILLCAFQVGVAGRFVAYESFPEGYYTTNEATTTVHDEYLPIWVTQKPHQRAKEKLEFHAGGGTITQNRVTTQYIDASIQASEDSILQINTVYYPGWGVTLDEKLVPIDQANALGVMRLVVPKGQHRIVASFRETVFRFIADIVSVVSLLLFILFAVRVRPKPKKRNL